MMHAPMATTKSTKNTTRAGTTTRRTSPGRAASMPAKAKATEPEARSLSEIGREAQRAALLEECERQGWNLTHVAASLSLSSASNVIRSLRTLGLEEEYEAAKERGDVRAGRGDTR